MGEYVYKISRHHAASEACQTTQFGVKSVKDSSSVTLKKRIQLNARLCIFEDNKEYLK